MKKDLFDASLPKIERKLGYTFRDKSLIRQAFTRTSFCNEHPGEKLQSNEVLEFFGDGVLSVTIISFLLESRTERYAHGIKTELHEGDFSNIKSKLSDKTNLSRSIERLGLESYLLLGEGDKKLGIENEPSVMEDLFESIVGAVYIDSEKNMSDVARVVSNILDMSVYEKNSKPAQSAKNSLQEFCADKSRRLPPPEYKTLKEEGPDHKKSYTRGVYIGGELIAEGEGKNLKIADANAATAALSVLEKKESSKGKPDTPPRAKKSKQNQRVQSSTENKEIPPQNSQKKQETTRNNPQRKSKAPDTKSKKKLPDSLAPGESKASGTKNIQSTKRNKPEVTRKNKTSATSSPSTDKKEIRQARVSAPKSADETGTASIALKAYAANRGILSPAYHDLGMMRTHSGNIEYRIECRFAGKSTTATATSRPLAREKASAEMARLLKIKI